MKNLRENVKNFPLFPIFKKKLKSYGVTNSCKDFNTGNR